MNSFSASELQAFADELLSIRSGDGLMLHDSSIGDTHGIVASFGDNSDTHSAILSQANREAFAELMTDVDPHGNDHYFGGYGGAFGSGEWLIVRVYEPECEVSTSGLHDAHWSSDPHGYEDVPGFEDDVITYCIECGEEYVGDGLTTGPKAYTQAFLAAYEASLALRDYPVLDEGRLSRLEYEEYERQLSEAIYRKLNDYDDDSDDDREAIQDLYFATDREDVAPYYPDVDEDLVAEGLELTRNQYFTARGRST